MSALAWWQPQWFVFAKPAILPLLALIMFAMGLTLTVNDFKRVLKMPGVIVLGTLLQFGLMPLLAWMIAAGLKLEPLLAAGLILVGACSGGTASNVITYLARGNVALSITLTAVSTLLAVVMTPWLSWLYIDTAIAVPVWSMLKTILWLVILPVVSGVLINQFFHRFVKPVQRMCPLIAVLAIVLIIAIIVALNQPRLAGISSILLLAVMMHNLAGLLLGYGISRLMGYSGAVSRTLAIEVGMQNSGLAVALALKYFAPLAALPGALFSIWHNISGSLLASWWQRQPSIERAES
ncbi:bile acid:sodium symporter family protein [Methylophaga sp. OBS4]|uniref:bile acid:sodium symporter family protein n=1 Tax=Methylophaga sp. OBS4 TaxID=2991935 RepID=UPI00224DE3B3|nr:bile acid:sodium symporter family protein [Methylophaga sp. OBS4]MCX4186553.1 bile acid:sodium symporter family protein [Methylophaga sp. OBS4]